MFSILPDNLDTPVEDAQYFDDLEDATEAAFDWSVELGGSAVKIYEDQGEAYIAIRSVWA